MARDAGAEDHIHLSDDNYHIVLNDTSRLKVSPTAVVPGAPLMSASVSSTILSASVATAAVASTHHFIFADASGAEMGLTLPAAATVIGRSYTVKKIDASGNAVLLSGSTGESVEGAAFQTITGQSGSMTVVSDGVGYHIIGFFSGVLST